MTDTTISSTGQSIITVLGMIHRTGQQATTSDIAALVGITVDRLHTECVALEAAGYLHIARDCDQHQAQGRITGPTRLVLIRCVLDSLRPAALVESLVMHYGLERPEAESLIDSIADAGLIDDYATETYDITDDGLAVLHDDVTQGVVDTDPLLTRLLTAQLAGLAGGDCDIPEWSARITDTYWGPCCTDPDQTV